MTPASLRRVLLIEPYPGAKWVSITNYAATIAAQDGFDGVAIRTARAPWWNPPSLVRGASWRRQPAVRERAKWPDAVHLTDHALGHHVGTFSRRPVVVTCHDVMAFALPGYHRAAVSGALKQVFLRHSISGLLRADGIITDSTWTAGELVRLFGADPERIDVVPIMAGERFQPCGRVEVEAALRAAGVLLPGGPRVLSIGHAGPYKNLEALIAALARPELAGVTLVRVGGALAPGQRDLVARLNLAGRVVELGRLPGPLVPKVFAACDALAQPSLGEGFGLPVIEAMASGLPVVCSDGGALPEVAGEAAVVVPLNGDRGAEGEFPAALARALQRVVESPGRAAELCQFGLARVEAFRPAAVVPRLFAAYTRAMERRG